jgi:hypothetical protein
MLQNVVSRPQTRNVSPLGITTTNIGRSQRSGGGQLGASKNGTMMRGG